MTIKKRTEADIALERQIRKIRRLFYESIERKDKSATIRSRITVSSGGVREWMVERL